MDKLTLEEVERWQGGSPDEDRLAHQLADTMRENEELKRYPLKMICEKCGVLTDVDLPNRESDNG